MSRLAAAGVLFLFLDQFLREMTGDTTFISFGFYSLHLVDIGVLLLGMSLIGTFSGKTDIKLGLTPILIFATLYTIDTARGLYSDPFQALFALRERMPLVLLGLIVLLRSAANPENKIGYFKSVIVFAFLCFVALFALRMVFGANLFLRGTTLVDAQFNELRALTSYSAIFLACSSLLFLHWGLYSEGAKDRRLYGFLAALGLIVVLLTRQRTATLATVFALIVYLAASPETLRRLPKAITFGAAAIIAAVLMVTFFAGVDTLFEKILPESFRHAAEKRSTLDFRKALWASAIADVLDRDTINLLLGPSMGTLPDLAANGIKWDKSLHSFYMETLFDDGVLGVAALVIMYVYAGFSFIRMKLMGIAENGFGVPGPVGLSWIAALLIYGYSYDMRPVLDLTLVALLVPATAGWQKHEAKRPTGVRMRLAAVT